MSILYGLEEPTSGDILINGSPVTFGSPVAAAQAGIGMVHQEFKLFPSLTVAENVVFRSEPTSGGFLLDRKAAEVRVAELAKQFGLGSIREPRSAGCRSVCCNASRSSRLCIERRKYSSSTSRQPS
jgi:ABC-type uncharacterized transport system ATPase subunit